MNPSDVTFFELEVLVKIGETQSLRETARQLNLTPGHVSKVLKRLEGKAGKALLKRSATGMLLSPAGIGFYKHARRLLEQSAFLYGGIGSEQEEQNVISIASISFINSHLLPHCLSSIGSNRFRLLDVATSSMVSSGIEGAFEIAIHVGKLYWPRSWTSVKVGKLKSGLFVRANHPLLPRATEEEVQQHPFIIPTYWSGEEFVVGQDQCPIPVNERRKGHEASTALTAMSLILRSDQLAFLPKLITQRELELGLLGEVKVEGWEDSGEELYLSVDNKSIKQTLRHQLVKEIQRRL